MSIADRRRASKPLRAVGSSGRLSGQVYEELKARLLAGAFAGGQSLSVEELRAEFGVSKQPVMEAMRLLVGDGLVEIFPQVGSAVASYTVEEAADFFRIFARFEGAMAEVAASRAKAADVRLLRAHAARMHDLESSSDDVERQQGYSLGNRQFHELIHDMAGSPLMVSTSRRLWDLSDFLIATAGPRAVMSPVLADRNHDHDEIVDAIAAGDAGAAGAVMERHILGVIDLIQPG